MEKLTELKGQIEKSIIIDGVYNGPFKVIHRNTLHLYTQAMKNQKEKSRKYSTLHPKD